MRSPSPPLNIPGHVHAGSTLIFRNAPLSVAAAIMRESALSFEQRGEKLWDQESLSDANLAAHCEPHEVFVGELAAETVVAALIQDRDPAIWPDDGTALIILISHPPP